MLKFVYDIRFQQTRNECNLILECTRISFSKLNLIVSSDDDSDDKSEKTFEPLT